MGMNPDDIPSFDTSKKAEDVKPEEPKTENV